MHIWSVLGWLAIGWLALIAFRYLLGARIYLTCALSEAPARGIDRQQLTATDLELLFVCNAALEDCGFRLLGFGEVAPLITYYGSPSKVALYAHAQIPAIAVVQRSLAPEYGKLTKVEIATAFATGHTLVTVDMAHMDMFAPERFRFDLQPGAAIPDLVRRHRERVDAERPNTTPLNTASLEDALAYLSGKFAETRELFRARGLVVPTSNPRLDRFTLRGAFLLTHLSMRVFGKAARRTVRANLPVVASDEEQKRLRVEADLDAVMHMADNPVRAPGTPWPLLTVIVATAAASFAAMAWMWNAFVASLILVVVAFHEAGHAFAMRRLGYRDVHVFFVPLLGAMTVGNAAVTTVRNRLSVLLAGPLPGLWLGVILLAFDRSFGPVFEVHIAAITLLLLNGLNLLPFTPLDGGRVLESLSHPESVWRPLVHGASTVGLLALAAFFKDPLLATLGIAWLLLLPRQILGHRLRRSIAASVHDRSNFRGVARVALQTMTGARYATFSSGARQLSARALARMFTESLATPADRRWGAMAYAFAWLPILIALILWHTR